MYFGIVKSCQIMCSFIDFWYVYKVVIENQVENTKFTQENTFSTCTSISPQNLLPPQYILNTLSFMDQQKSECKNTCNLFVWNSNWDPFKMVFKGHYKPSIRRLFRERHFVYPASLL